MGNIETVFLKKKVPMNDVHETISKFLDKNYPKCFEVELTKFSIEVRFIIPELKDYNLASIYPNRGQKSYASKMPFIGGLWSYWILIQVFTELLNKYNQSGYRVNEGDSKKSYYDPKHHGNYLTYLKKEDVLWRKMMKMLSIPKPIRKHLLKEIKYD